ncbi:hypothetical protein BLNAU_9447 [Blattamonas nauphoetae]|uniref:Uncharacterized protein n=1 Tax=Blattamonas nauphoetae TaxID=2049346 RepID=A0ABQ9XVT1_9EUKA|nr:hypothetical protein BLNAU_9447 [Blattamonas nauphoetae]
MSSPVNPSDEFILRQAVLNFWTSSLNASRKYFTSQQFIVHLRDGTIPCLIVRGLISPHHVITFKKHPKRQQDILVNFMIFQQAIREHIDPSFDCQFPVTDIEAGKYDIRLTDLLFKLGIFYYENFTPERSIKQFQDLWLQSLADDISIFADRDAYKGADLSVEFEGPPDTSLICLTTFRRRTNVPTPEIPRKQVLTQPQSDNILLLQKRPTEIPRPKGSLSSSSDDFVLTSHPLSPEPKVNRESLSAVSFPKTSEVPSSPSTKSQKRKAKRSASMKQTLDLSPSDSSTMSSDSPASFVGSPLHLDATISGSPLVSFSSTFTGTGTSESDLCETREVESTYENTFHSLTERSLPPSTLASTRQSHTHVPISTSVTLSSQLTATQNATKQSSGSPTGNESKRKRNKSKSKTSTTGQSPKSPTTQSPSTHESGNEHSPTRHSPLSPIPDDQSDLSLSLALTPPPDEHDVPPANSDAYNIIVGLVPPEQPSSISHTVNNQNTNLSPPTLKSPLCTRTSITLIVLILVTFSFGTITAVILLRRSSNKTSNNLDEKPTLENSYVAGIPFDWFDDSECSSDGGKCKKPSESDDGKDEGLIFDWGMLSESEKTLYTPHSTRCMRYDALALDSDLEEGETETEEQKEPLPSNDQDDTPNTLSSIPSTPSVDSPSSNRANPLSSFLSLSFLVPAENTQTDPTVTFLFPSSIAFDEDLDEEPVHSLEGPDVHVPDGKELDKNMLADLNERKRKNEVPNHDTKHSVPLSAPLDGQKGSYGRIKEPRVTPLMGAVDDEEQENRDHTNRQSLPSDQKSQFAQYPFTFTFTRSDSQETTRIYRSVPRSRRETP